DIHASRADLTGSLHVASADPRAGAAGAYRLADSHGPVRRIERDLDRVVALIQQGLQVRGRLLRGDAAEDGHEGEPERQGRGAHARAPRWHGVIVCTTCVGAVSVGVVEGGRARAGVEGYRPGRATRVASPG